jgi:ribosomal protein S18 acetylase RimI-like enzyme
MAMTVAWILRQASENDREFLYELHCRTMREVIEKTWGWDEEWQRKDFDRRFADYFASVIESDGRRIGGLLLEPSQDFIYIHEIQVLPEWQGQGIGTAVVRQIIEQAANRGASVTLSVVPANPRAKQLYERLGFEVTGFEAPFFRMRFSPPNGAA